MSPEKRTPPVKNGRAGAASGNPIHLRGEPCPMPFGNPAIVVTEAGRPASDAKGLTPRTQPFGQRLFDRGTCSSAGSPCYAMYHAVTLRDCTEIPEHESGRRSNRLGPTRGARRGPTDRNPSWPLGARLALT